MSIDRLCISTVIITVSAGEKTVSVGSSSPTLTHWVQFVLAVNGHTTRCTGPVVVVMHIGCCVEVMTTLWPLDWRIVCFSDMLVTCLCFAQLILFD